MDELSAFPESRRDDLLDATRYALIYGQAAVRQNFDMATIDTTHYGPSLTAMLPPMEVGRIDGIQITEAPKEEKMNELMTAIEAMITRIVQAELAKIPAPEPLNFDKAFEKFIDDNTPKFAAIVSQGALDQPWFDDAIKAEVARNFETMAPAQQGYMFASKEAFENAVATYVRNNDGISDWVHDKAIDAVRDVNFSVRVA